MPNFEINSPETLESPVLEETIASGEEVLERENRELENLIALRENFENMSLEGLKGELELRIKSQKEVVSLVESLLDKLEALKKEESAKKAA